MASSASTETDLSLLCQAVAAGDSKRVRRRLSMFGDDINQRSDKYLATPLMHALANGHLNVARLLVREGADVTLKDSEGRNIIHSSIYSRQVALTLWAIEQCAAKGVGVNDQDNKGWTSLMLSVNRGTIDICTLLLSKGSDPSIRANDGQGLIHGAAVRGFERSIDFALAHGSNVDDVSSNGVTALMLCVESGNLEASCYLLDLGADPTLTHSSGQTAFDMAKSDEMKSLLLKATEAFTPKKPSATPLTPAEMLSILLKANEAFNPKKPSATPPTPTTTTTRTPPANTGVTGPVSLVKKDPKSCDTCGLMEVVGENLFPICPICKVAKYCGRECQKADWKKHKPLCAGLRMKRKKEN